MAAWSIADFARLHQGLDFDAEHYHPERLRAWSKLANNATKTVNDFAMEIEDLQNPVTSKPSYDLTAALNQFLDLSGTAEATSTKKVAMPGDVLVSRLRSYLREACVVPAREHGFAPQISTEFIVVRSRSKRPTSWLLPYILSEPVQAVLRWTQTGSNHPRFSAKTLFEIPVNSAIEAILYTLNALVESAVDKFELSATAYPAAEAELLDRLGWEKLRQSPIELSYVRNFSELTVAARTDAEHFQPQYVRLRAQLAKQGKTLGGLVTHFDKGTQPDGYADGGEVMVVKSKQVTGSGLSLESCERTTGNAWSDVSARLSAGDLVINSTGRGTLGRAAVIPTHSGKAVAAVDLVVARLRTDLIHPEYAALFLNSPAGLAQSDQFQTGSSGQLHLYPQHFAQFLIYLPRQKNGKVDMAWQKRLAAKVEASTAAKVAARAKLEEAKRLVEEALNK